MTKQVNTVILETPGKPYRYVDLDGHEPEALLLGEKVFKLNGTGVVELSEPDEEGKQSKITLPMYTEIVIGIITAGDRDTLL